VKIVKSSVEKGDYTLLIKRIRGLNKDKVKILWLELKVLIYQKIREVLSR